LRFEDEFFDGRFDDVDPDEEDSDVDRVELGEEEDRFDSEDLEAKPYPWFLRELFCFEEELLGSARSPKPLSGEGDGTGAESDEGD
jgi:hypothetical protein